MTAQDDVQTLRKLLAGIVSRKSRAEGIDDTFQSITQKLDRILNSKLPMIPTRLYLILSHGKFSEIKTRLRTLKDDLQTAASAESVQVLTLPSSYSGLTNTRRSESSASPPYMGIVRRNYITACDSSSNAAQSRASRCSTKSTYRSRSVTKYAASAKVSSRHPKQLGHNMSELQHIGMLEPSSTYFPESYTNQSQIPKVIVFGRREELVTSRSTINLY